LATAKFFPNDAIAEAGSDFKELHITIHLRPTYNGLSASAQIRKAATVVDEIEGRWMFPQGRARLARPMSPSSSGLLRIGGDVKAPVIRHRVEPIYSEEARKARISGIVIVEA